MTSAPAEPPATDVRRAVLAHAALAALALVAVSWFVGPPGYFFIDEAAFHAQLEVLDELDAWVVPEPFDRAPGSGIGGAMARDHDVEGGYAPFVKHPVHLQLAHLADDLAGRAGVRALSTIGAAVAAAATGLLAVSLGRRPAVLAVWLTALASPLVFHAQLVVGHALAAGVAALLVWRVHAARRWRADPVLAALLGAAGVLVRSEVALLLASTVAVHAVWSLRARRWNRFSVAVAAAVGGAAAYLAEPRLVERWVGGESAPATISAGSRGGAEGSLSGLRVALLQADLARPGALSALTVVLVGALGALALLRLRSRPTDPGLAAVLGVATLGAAIVHLTEPDVVAGILWAFPALWLLVGLRRGDLGSDVVGPGLAIAGVFAIAVLATQYEVAGSGMEWGWRYFAVGLPALVPALALGADRLWRAAGADRTLLVGLGAVAVAFLLVPASGIVEQRRYLSDTEYFLDRSAALADEVDVIVTVDPSFSRLAYPLTIDGRVATATSLPEAVETVAEAGADRIAVLWRGDDAPDVDLGTVLEEVYVAADYRARILEP